MLVELQTQRRKGLVNPAGGLLVDVRTKEFFLLFFFSFWHFFEFQESTYHWVICIE
jgi:hypothetical protein